MATDSELFTIEQSHGKPRLTGPRPSDLGTVETGGDRGRDRDAGGRFQTGDKAAVGRSAKRALRAAYSAANDRLKSVVGEGPVADQLLADASAVHRAARLELGTSSVFVEGPSIAYAVESVLAGYFMAEAAQAGFLSDRGLELHQRAMQCETQAQRAMTAALAAVKALKDRRKADDPLAALDRRLGITSGGKP